MTRRPFFVHLLLILFLTQCTKLHPTIPTDTPAHIKTLDNVDVALVLGGGGSKGIAHIGAIAVLEENHIPIDLIVGSSAGSEVGALYADSRDITKVKSLLFKAKREELLDFSILDALTMFHNLTAPVRGQAYESFISKNLSAKTFSSLKIPLVVVTVDSQTGQKFIINNGLIAPAIRASSAIPPIIAPVSLHGRILFDGGILEPVPVATAKKYHPKLTIAIDISNHPPKTKPANVLELTYRAVWLSYYQLSRMQAGLADIDIHPDLSGHGTFEDDKKDELYQLGRKAALEALPQLMYKLKTLGIKLREH